MISLSQAWCSSACSSARSAHRLASPCNPATLAARLCLAASSDGTETVTTASSLLLPPLAAAPRFLRPRPPRSPLLRFSPLPASLSALTGASGAAPAVECAEPAPDAAASDAPAPGAGPLSPALCAAGCAVPAAPFGAASTAPLVCQAESAAAATCAGPAVVFAAAVPSLAPALCAIVGTVCSAASIVLRGSIAAPFDCIAAKPPGSRTSGTPGGASKSATLTVVTVRSGPCMSARLIFSGACEGATCDRARAEALLT